MQFSGAAVVVAHYAPAAAKMVHEGKVHAQNASQLVSRVVYLAQQGAHARAGI